MTLFGRLDIVHPDGQIERHQLRGNEATIGSAHSCAIVLDHNSVADLHCRIAAAGDGVYIIDLGSAAGTTVDGLRLQSNMPVPLADTAAIEIGSLHLTFYKQSDSPTVAMPTFNEQTQPAAIGFRAQLETVQITVFPASNVTVPLSITNTSQADAEFRVEIAGLPDGWVKPEKLTFPLPARESTELRFLIKPERRSDIPPQQLPLDVNITRLDDSQQILRLVGTIELGGFGGLSLAIDPSLCSDNGQFNLYLLNQGNESLNVNLECSDPQDKLDLRLSPSAVTMPPGGRFHVSGHVRSRRRPLIGNVQELPFVLVAEAQNPAAYRVALPASVTVKPRVPGRVAALLSVVILIGALLAAAILYEPPVPQIAGFSLSTSQVAQGTPVHLSWTAENAERFVVEVDRVPVAELPGDTSSFTLDTADYADPIDIALIAQRADATAIETISLEVYQPVSITQFYVDRPSMLRHVVGALTVRWAAEGAASLDMILPGGFEVVRESRVSNSNGETTLRGIPNADFEVQLSANDELGNTTVSTLQITVRDPECSPRSDTTLYAGPDSRYTPLRIAVEHVPVLIRGRNATSDWLQIEMASGQVGWGEYSQFFCQGFTPESLQVITDIPTLPTYTPTSAPTNTSTPSQTATPSPTSRPSATPTTPSETPQA